jgi:threonine/homoserine/homoserine lactone efflux protein
MPALSTYALFLAAGIGLLAIPGPAVLYLVFLGVRRLLTRAGDEALHGPAPRSLRRLYTDGIVVNVLNPKTIVFIFAFLPQFVDVSRGHVWLQVLVLGLSFATLGMMGRKTGVCPREQSTAPLALT